MSKIIGDYLYRVELELGNDIGTDRMTKRQIPTDLRLEQYREGQTDPDLEVLLFQYGRYLLIASSRSGSQPANLQGIWNDRVQPPWNSNYTTNINTQMNYWYRRKYAILLSAMNPCCT